MASKYGKASNLVNEDNETPRNPYLNEQPSEYQP